VAERITSQTGSPHLAQTLNSGPDWPIHPDDVDLAHRRSQRWKRSFGFRRWKLAIEFGQIFFRYFDLDRTCVVVDVRFVARFGNGDDPGLAQHPCERDLRRRRVVSLRDFLERRVVQQTPTVADRCVGHGRHFILLAPWQEIKFDSAPAPNFSGGSKFFERFDSFAERDVIFSPMQQVKIDRIGAQASQTALTRFWQFRARCIVRVRFRNDEHAVALTRNCVRHNFFCAAITVHYRCIDQGHPELDSEMQSQDFIAMRMLVLAHAPRALAQSWDALASRDGNGFHPYIQ
jgi:hypothetical protein